MSAFRLILLSLVHHGRMHAAVACGVAAGTAVLTGALLVGDSMRESLRRLTLDRLGRVDQALTVDRFFRAALADELARRPGFPAQAAAVPVIMLQVSVSGADSDTPVRANRVSLIGCDARFWQLGPGAPGRLPEGREIVLNEPLAKQLGVRAGDSVIVRLPHSSSIPADTPLGRKSETVRSQRFRVSEIIAAKGLGRFALRPGQQTPRNAYLPLDVLQERLEQPGRANAILAAGADQSVQTLLVPRPEDYGIRVERAKRGYVNITSDRMLLEPTAEQAILRALGARRTQPAFTYLANTIACRQREIPYSTITAVDFAAQAPLGPMVTPDGKPIATPAEDEIVLNAWAAEDLQARPGDRIEVTYFEPESPGGAVHSRTVAFRLAAVAALSGAAADPDFTPAVPGVTDQLTMANWDPPFPFDARRVRKKDDQYWEAHRGTPKAFVALATGRRLWGSRFGQTTSLRVGEAGPGAAEQVRDTLRLEPAAMGFVFQPVKEQGLAASAGTTPFELLFLGFSSFLIVAATMLVALLFRLGVDRRADQIGILLAVGWRRRQVAGLLAAEGLVVAALGSLLGLAVGVGYAALMILGLHTWWLAAIGTPFLELHGTWTSLAIGYASGLAVAWAAIAWSARRAARNSPRRLLAGQVGADGLSRPRQGRRAAWVAWGLLAAAVGAGVGAAMADQQLQAIAFFAAASFVLGASLVLVWVRLVRGATGPAVAVGRGNLLRLAVRNAARNPGRATFTVGLVAAASFLIVALSAFRVDQAQQRPDRSSGNGGFALVAESDQPIYFDLNTAEGRAELGFSADDSRLLATASTTALRVRAGDNASCLNLYRPQQPRVLGVPRPLIDRGGFDWAAVMSAAEVQSLAALDAAQAKAAVENPWQLLALDLGRDADGVPRVPVVLEKNTANYSLHLWKGVGQTYEIRDGSGRPVRLVIVGLLGASIFQGDLLVGEQAFLRLFPDESGYRFFLVEMNNGKAGMERFSGPGDGSDVSSAQLVQQALDRTLGDFGFAAETSGQRLAAFQAVQNTYLSTFQSLGGLGLLLGTFGLAAVQLRSVLERRRELALLRATGFRRRLLAWMVTLENAMLLVAGLGCGVLSAAVAVLPHLWTRAAAIPVAWLAGTLGLVLAVGLLAGLAAVRSALRIPLLGALRGD